MRPEAFVLRGPNYGVMTLIPRDGCAEVTNHGLPRNDLLAALGVLDGLGKVCDVEKHGGKTSGKWKFGMPVDSALLRFEAGMRANGYCSDPYEDRSMSRVSVSDAENPDYPDFSHMQFHEGIERGIRRAGDFVASILGPSGTFQLADVAAFPMRRRGSCGQALPFVRVRGFVHDPVDTAAGVRQSLLRSLPKDGLLRASVIENGNRYAVEVGCVLSEDECSRHVIGCAPCYDRGSVRGYRTVQFKLTSPLNELDVTRLKSALRESPAVSSVAFPSARRIVARVAATHLGEALQDVGFQDVVGWMTYQLSDWCPTLGFTGPCVPLDQKVLA